MSIAENHGGLYDNLKTLRETDGKAQCNFFKALGFDYLYVNEGNNIEKLISAFKQVKDINHPVVVHIHTQKGCGLKIAEINKEAFHWIMPGILDEKPNQTPVELKETYYLITNYYILKKAQEDKDFIVLTAATPGVFGFNKSFRKKLGTQYTDVGIAEEHAAAYAAGLAKSGAKPIWAVMSSFVQRTYDQLSQDICLNNAPVTMLVYWGGISEADATHLCIFDIPLISNIPNMVYLAPTYKEEYLSMLDWAVNQNEHPVAIRVPSCELISTGIKDNTNYSVLNKYKIEVQGSEIAIIALGSFFALGGRLKEYLKVKLNINATLINPRFITGLDVDLLENLKSNHKLVVTLEDGVLSGGFGEKISRFYSNSDMKVLNFGAEKEFTDRIPLEELYIRYHLTEELMTKDIEKCLNLDKI